MNSTEQPPPGRRRREAPETSNGLPLWLTILVVIWLLCLVTWNIVVVGPEGLGATYVLGGLLGAYAGVNELLKKRRSGGDDADRG